MRRMRRPVAVLPPLVAGATLLACAVLPAATPAPAYRPAPVPASTRGPVGWDVYRHLGRLPQLHPAARTRQFSSFDRTGGNRDRWFRPEQCLRRAAGRCVVAEHSGPGEVDAIWFTANGGDVRGVGRIAITLDGRTVLHAPLPDVVNGRLGAPFVYPVVANAEQSSGGVYIAAPMPFRDSMLITTEGSAFYYHVTYRTFPDAAGVSTFDPTDPASDVLAVLRAAGTRDPKPPRPGAHTSGAAADLAPGASRTLAVVRGPGELTAVRVRLPQAHPVVPTVSTHGGVAFGRGGSSTFTVRLDPRNTGVRLTRRLDPAVGRQVASLAVDGRVVARWAPDAAPASQPGTPHWPYAVPVAGGEWAEQSVDLPASATAGKRQITIRNTVGSADRDFNEFGYQVDSRLPGGLRRTDTVDVGGPASRATHAYRVTGQTWRGSRTLADPLDPARLAELRVAQQLLAGLRLRISFDGQTLVDAPVGEFFGTGFAVTPVRALMFGVDAAPDGWYSAWWPMPYRAEAAVQLHNGSLLPVLGAEVRVTATPDVATSDDLAAGRIGYFRTASAAGPTTPGQDWTLLRATGTGRVVGVTADLRGPVDRTHLEGDERVYVDGLRSPELHGTGTEDFFHGGWFFNRGPFGTPLYGSTAHLTATSGCAPNADCTSGYRLMLADAVPFDADLAFGIEHGGANDVAGYYASTVYWYGAGWPTARQTDQLTVADPASEAAHGYASPEAAAVTPVRSTFEGRHGTEQPMAGEVRATTAPVMFTLALDPANAGALLIRTSDQARGYQAVRVSVDGHALPDWVQPLANPYHRWLEDGYPLPGSVTAGRPAITVTLTPLPDAPAWSAAGYRVLSLAGPPGE
jgi:hypothetical protein